MFSKTIIMGNIGSKDSKLMQDGSQVVEMSVATNKKYTNKYGEKQQKTTWHKVVAFAKTADLIDKYCQKGDLVLLEGEIDNQSYTANDGSKKNTSKIICNNVRFIPKNKKNEQDNTEESHFTKEGFDDEVPF